MEKRRLSPSEIGLYLSFHRNDFDWNKSDVAESVGITPTLLNRIIMGNAAAALNDAELVSLARAAGIAEDYFVREHVFRTL
ncbi:MAG: hypothetical protein HOM25_07795 [Rhodospirillaceae bacterium]|jgi:transcriptional regulator with XRE-family HTH domain|nr:hypothetical protein [Rhodospirillaceae bacterium]MBT5667188.1 hypothetical protein [Rhodospirillaceae bacterium]MBT5809686.1 hypothetical protein [Rhodospirillaceae bacterium]